MPLFFFFSFLFYFFLRNDRGFASLLFLLVAFCILRWLVIHTYIHIEHELIWLGGGAGRES